MMMMMAEGVVKLGVVIISTIKNQSRSEKKSDEIASQETSLRYKKLTAYRIWSLSMRSLPLGIYFERADALFSETDKINSFVCFHLKIVLLETLA